MKFRDVYTRELPFVLFIMEISSFLHYIMKERGEKASDGGNFKCGGMILTTCAGE